MLQKLLALNWQLTGCASRIDDPSRYVLMNDPFATESESVDQFISGLRARDEFLPA